MTRETCIMVSGAAILIAMQTTEALSAPGLRDVAGNAAICERIEAQPLIIPVQSRAHEFVVSNVKGRSGVAVPLGIRAPADATDDDLYAISRLPDQMTLSAGGQRNHIWIVKQKYIQSLSVMAPKGFRGSVNVTLTRAQSKSHEEQTRTFSITIVDSDAETAENNDTQVTAAIPPKPLELDNIQEPRVRTQQEQMLFVRAITQLERGDIAGGRSILEFLALKNDAEAALIVAESYDPATRNSWFAGAATPDKQKARLWYGRAKQMGAPQTQARIDALGSD